MISSRHSGDIEIVEVPTRRPVFIPTIARVFDLGFSLIYTLLGIRLLLVFFSARQDTGFATLIAGLSGPFYAPFRDIVPTTQLSGFPVAWSIIVAMVAYGLLHGVINALLRLAGGRR